MTRPRAARRTVRLVLPHQLFDAQLDCPSDDLVLIEHDLLLRQYAFHAHKLILHRASMDRFARRAELAGFTVHRIRTSEDRASRAQITNLLARLGAARVTWFDVVDDWLDGELRAAARRAAVRSRRTGGSSGATSKRNSLAFRKDTTDLSWAAIG